MLCVNFPLRLHFNSMRFYFLFIIIFNIGVCKTEAEDEGPSTEEDSPSFHGTGVCKWFNVRMGFGFLSMTSRDGAALDEPVDVFVHQVRTGTETHPNNDTHTCCVPPFGCDL